MFKPFIFAFLVMVRRSLLFLFGFSLMLAGSCSKDGAYRVLVTFEPSELADQITKIDLAIVESCANQPIKAPDKPVVPAVQLLRALPQQDLFEKVRPGGYGLWARGLNSANCAITYDCINIRVSAGGDSTLQVTLKPIPKVCFRLDGEPCECAQCADCDNGTCIPNHQMCATGQYCDPRKGEDCKEGQMCAAEEFGGCEVPPDTCSTNVCNSSTGKCDTTTAVAGMACTVNETSATGKCNGGSCCSGCFVGMIGNGAECHAGEDVPFCGVAGNSCESCCSDPGCRCEDGHCVAFTEALGGGHSCAIRGAAGLFCWGQNTDGQVGNGTTMTQLRPVAISLPNVVKVSLGESHTCAVVRNGDVYCWGDNTDGQLGVSATADQLTPQKVTAVSGAVTVSANGNHTCALVGDGRVFCWGSNRDKELGRQSPDTSSMPQAISGISSTSTPPNPATDIASGASHTCAVRLDHSIWCWGKNTNGQLGNGTVAGSASPQKVANIMSASRVVAGLTHTCALLTDGTVSCWGANLEGQLGNGGTAQSPVPIPVPNLSGVSQISTLREHVCVVTLANAVYCWGANATFELATATGDRSPSPLMVSGLSMPVSIAAGRGTSCARLAPSNELRCWGANGLGQLGDNMTAVRRETPMPVLFP